jgi:hypothetical protein
MAGSKAACVGRYYKSAQPCFLASCIRHIIEKARNEETQPDFLPALKRQYEVDKQQQN